MFHSCHFKCFILYSFISLLFSFIIFFTLFLPPPTSLHTLRSLHIILLFNLSLRQLRSPLHSPQPFSNTSSTPLSHNLSSNIYTPVQTHELIHGGPGSCLSPATPFRPAKAWGRTEQLEGTRQPPWQEQRCLVGTVAWREHDSSSEGHKSTHEQ